MGGESLVSSYSRFKPGEILPWTQLSQSSLSSVVLVAHGTETRDVSVTDICSLPMDIHRYCQALDVFEPSSSVAVTTGNVERTFGGY